MNWLSTICFIFFSLTAVAQNDTTYNGLLNSTKEINITDSISINKNQWLALRLDTNLVKKWFRQILPSTPNNRLKNRAYYLAGKITSNPIFNILVVLEEKRQTDSTNSRIVYLFTTKKDGTYISSLETIVIGNRKKSIFSTASWLYWDNRIVQDYKITLNQKIYADLRKYKLNKTG
ncbi:MAG: hypothetical protein ABIU11_08270, partial [Chitinophagaceae bacterium]